jgi:hypothetical protein
MTHGLDAVVARGEVDPDPLGGRLDQRVIDRLDEPGRQELAAPSVRVGDDVGQVPIHDMVHRRVEIPVVVRRADVDDLRARRHAVYGLDVERLLAVPALWVLLLVLRTPVRSRRNDLDQLDGDIVCSPRRVDQVLTSWRIVGDAYASMTATVCPRPSREVGIQYALLICCGVYPRTVHGTDGRFRSVNPVGNAYGDSSCAQ